MGGGGFQSPPGSESTTGPIRLKFSQYLQGFFYNGMLLKMVIYDRNM
jgi:hypothetical protein